MKNRYKFFIMCWEKRTGLVVGVGDMEKKLYHDIFAWDHDFDILSRYSKKKKKKKKRGYKAFFLSFVAPNRRQIVGILRVGMRTGCRNTPRTYDRRAGGGGSHRNTPQTYDRRGGGGGVCHRNTPRTYDRRGCLKRRTNTRPAWCCAGRRTGLWKTGQSGLKPDEWPP